jgi:hypothetical protein
MARESFTERMELGKANAMNQRNRGQHVGKCAKGWNYKRRYDDVDPQSWAWLCEEAKREWRSACRQAQNDFAVACLNPLNDQPETWEF